MKDITLRIKVRLATGREVQLSRLHLLASMVDWTDASQPKRMIDQLPELVERYMGTAIPWLVKNPRDTEMPITCIALVRVNANARSHAVQIENSLLGRLLGSPKTLHCTAWRDIACEGLSDIDWEKSAWDFHSDW